MKSHVHLAQARHQAGIAEAVVQMVVQNLAQHQLSVLRQIVLLKKEVAHQGSLDNKKRIGLAVVYKS